MLVASVISHPIERACDTPGPARANSLEKPIAGSGVCRHARDTQELSSNRTKEHSDESERTDDD